ncbi:MAG: lasso peptide biosynthesis protein [Planctomycetia bacterium]|nr:lasso peptide biosynthesis protein [Planctomycetia bacterium]
MIRAAERTSLLAEVLRVLAALPAVEIARRVCGPQALLATLRDARWRRLERDAAGRQRLRRAVGWVDRHLGSGGNCYRRALLEIALDRGVAAEPVYFGLKLENERLDGHAWLPGQTDGGAFPFTIRL